MTFDRLERNIIDLVEEEQLKLGYAEETVRFYYPAESLRSILGTDAENAGLDKILGDFAESVKERLGNITVSEKNGRYCISVPPEGGRYVHTELPENVFLKEFIEVISRHGAGMSDVISVFEKYSDKVVTGKPATDEFDLLVYFEDGCPDGYYYCIKDEGIHLSYHRFLKDDYLAMYGVSDTP